MCCGCVLTNYDCGHTIAKSTLPDLRKKRASERFCILVLVFRRLPPPRHPELDFTATGSFTRNQDRWSAAGGRGAPPNTPPPPGVWLLLPRRGQAPDSLSALKERRSMRCTSGVLLLML